MRSGASVYGSCSQAVRDPRAPSTNRSPASPRAPVCVDQRAGLCGGGHRLAPVADHLDAVIEGPQLQPVVEPADLGAGAFVHRDDAGRGRGPQRRGPGFGQLFGGQQVTGDGADQVVSVAGQRPFGGEAGRRR